MVKVGDPVATQLSVTDWPAATLAGVAVKLVIAGGLPAAIVTLAVAVVDPKLFLAVRVYVVVADGFTAVDVPVTAPTPELMVSVGEPVVVQASVLVWPAPTLAGVAVKLVIAGGLPTLTVTLAVVDPKLFLAVMV
jgi:hypothetical protein